ncbi:hypothetical protein SAMN02990966_04697 [Rhodospirillales bacterium URHD0017]|nr:hypothetical protein SAMN02990966_04697 [Rhodospirillales bacterium URHD0017]
MTSRRAAHSQSEVSTLFRPMSEFDPSEPALVHDLRRDRLLPWSPSFQRSYQRTARELAPGVVDYDGLLLDGWMIPEDECQH